jgi:hypothetical protein
LTQLVREGLQNKEYPLFVAEGSSERKLAQIQGHGYLWYCLDKFSRVETSLVVFGHSFGPSDQHLTDAIGRNVKLKQIFIGLHSDVNSEGNRRIRQVVSRIRSQQAELRRRSPLEVRYFDSSSAAVWGS